MTSKAIFTAIGALSLVAIPVASQAAPAAAASVNSASSLSLSPAIRKGARTKRDKAAGSGIIIGIGMIALGAGAIVLAVDDNNDDSPDSN